VNLGGKKSWGDMQEFIFNFEGAWLFNEWDITWLHMSLLRLFSCFRFLFVVWRWYLILWEKTIFMTNHWILVPRTDSNMISQRCLPKNLQLNLIFTASCCVSLRKFSVYYLGNCLVTIMSDQGFWYFVLNPCYNSLPFRHWVKVI